MDKDQDMFFEENPQEDMPQQVQDEERMESPEPEEMDDLEFFLQLLDYLQDAVESGSVMPLTSKRLVDAEMCSDIITDLRKNIPSAVRYAKKVSEDRKAILENARRSAEYKTSNANVRANAAIDDAERQADQILESAEDRAKRIIEDAEIRARAMIDNNSIKVAAQNEAREIVNEARAEASERQLEASAYGENLLHNVERELLRAVDMVRGKRQNLMGE